MTARIGAKILFCLILTTVSHAQWIKQNVDTTASLRGLAVVNEKVVWASGTGGTVIRTIDGGKTWKVMTIPGAEKLDFRDVEAFDANTAYILSIGNGESSRIYKTTDGGNSWKLQFRNTNEKAFYDAIACWNKDYCFAVSDPVDGAFVLIGTIDGGKSWEKSRSSPPATEGEAAFAASGTCLVLFGPRSLSLVTGGTNARVLRAMFPVDSGDIKWISADVPFVKGTAGSGIFSLAMWDQQHGIIVGGDYEKPTDSKKNVALTSDSGFTWKLESGLSGYRSGVTYVDKKTIIAVGTNGSDITRDGGKTWKVLGKENLNAVQAKGRRAVWAVGPKGMVVKLK